MVRYATMVLVSMLLLGALAGCVDSGDEAGAPSDEDASSSASQSGARATADSFGDWWTMPTRAGPDAPLRGFEWTVPDGATSDYGFSDWQVVALEFAPMADNATAVEDIVLVVFRQEAGLLNPIYLYLDPTAMAESRLSVLPTSMQMTPSLDPFRIQFFVDPFDEIAEGDVLYFVVGIRAETTFDVDLGLRVAAGAENISDSGETFRSRVNGIPRPVATAGQGEGFNLAYYRETSFGLLVAPVGLVGTKLWTPAVEVTEAYPTETRPHPSVRDTTISASSELDPGTTFSSGLYYAYPAVTDWELQFDHRGHQGSEDGVVVAVDLTTMSVWWIATGVPTFSVQADGPGASTATMHVTSASANDYESLLFVQVDLGGDVPSLTGQEMKDEAVTIPGLLDGQQGETWIAADGPDFVVRPPTGPAIHVAGGDAR